MSNKASDKNVANEERLDGATIDFAVHKFEELLGEEKNRNV